MKGVFPLVFLTHEGFYGTVIGNFPQSFSLPSYSLRSYSRCNIFGSYVKYLKTLLILMFVQ